MGHTVWSQRTVLDTILSEIKDFGYVLRGEDAKLFQDVIERPLKHVGDISYASSFHVWAFMMMSIFIEQEKKINELKTKLEELI